MVTKKIEELMDLFLDNLEKVNKNDQIEIITTLKGLIHSYINDE